MKKICLFTLTLTLILNSCSNENNQKEKLIGRWSLSEYLAEEVVTNSEEATKDITERIESFLEDYNNDTGIEKGGYWFDFQSGNIVDFTTGGDIVARGTYRISGDRLIINTKYGWKYDYKFILEADRLTLYEDVTDDWQRVVPEGVVVEKVVVRKIYRLK